MNESGAICKSNVILAAVLRAAVFAALGLFFAHPSLKAQDTATIVGTVTDQSGAFVAGAQVTLVNQATQFTRVVETNASGQYVASSIPTGSYVITVLNTGFKQIKRSGIQLTAASTLTVDLKLSLGAETQTVSVFGTAPLLQEQTAEVSGLVDGRQMVALPLVSRDFTDLVLLTPGAHVGSAANLAQGASGYSMRGGADYSVNGSVSGGNSYLVDGVFDRNLWLNTLVMVPVVDSIQEYRVMTSNYSAQYGDAAGAVTEVDTKSGGNELHGDVWEFLRNDRLNANNYFNNLNHVPRPGFHRNQFGGTLGGPILRNKAFFFLDYEGIQASQPQTATSTIPSTAQQQMVETGNFANFGTTIYNPYSTTTVGGTTVRNAFVGNRIPSSLLDPAAVRLMQLLPAPTSSGAVNNYIFNSPLSQQTNQFDIRIDQNLRASDHLFARYGYDKSDFVTPGIIPSPRNSPVPIGPFLSTNASGTTEPLFNQSATLGYIKVMGEQLCQRISFGPGPLECANYPLGREFQHRDSSGYSGHQLQPTFGRPSSIHRFGNHGDRRQLNLPRRQRDHFRAVGLHAHRNSRIAHLEIWSGCTPPLVQRFFGVSDAWNLRFQWPVYASDRHLQFADSPR